MSKKSKDKKAKTPKDPKRAILLAGFTETELAGLAEAAAAEGKSRCAYIVECVKQAVGWA